MDINKTFKTNIPPHLPYKYITTSLDITGAKNGDTFYFNLDNDYDYLYARDYYKFIQITKNSIIGDVIVHTEPPVITINEFLTQPIFTIGGAENTNSAVTVPYAAPSNFGPKIPPFFSGSSLQTFQLNSNPINYFGHSAAKFPYGQDNFGNPNTQDNYKYLAITINSPFVPNGTLLVESGIVFVTLKVYLKL